MSLSSSRKLRIANLGMIRSETPFRCTSYDAICTGGRLMSGETDLNRLIASMHPKLRDGTYVFVAMLFDAADPVGLGAVMSFRERIRAVPKQG
jgi:ACT domain